MSTMVRMGELTNRYKLTARTAASVVEGVDTLIARLRRRGYQFRGRKLGVEGLVGAVVLDFLSWPEARQKELLERQIPALEALLDAQPDVPDEADDPQAGHGQTAFPASARAKKKKSG